MKSLLILLYLIPSLKALVHTETFTDNTRVESNTLVVNTELQALHSTLRTVNYTAASPPPWEFSVGNGEHGAFELATYANFSVGGDLSGNIIRLNTDEYPSLNVTKFELAQGWTLQPTGSNPLVIRSLTDVIVEGVIQCSGNNGQDAVGATPGVGGQGRCGGQNGGDGGAPTQDGTSGVDAGTGVTGGQAGNHTGGAAVGGAGGGSFNTTSAPQNGPNVNGGGGNAGTSVADPSFTELLGSAGGGGGSGTLTEAGAGGGAGGGAVIIYAVRDFILGAAPTSNYGTIRANGGVGGSSNVQGGPGGGGGGGSVQVFVGRNIEIYNTDGTGASQANFGAGGSNSLAVVGAQGGGGRSWFSSVGYNTSGTGFYTPAEQLPVDPITGRVEFSTQSQSLITKSFDLSSTRVSILNITSVPVTSEVAFEIAGSDDNFVNDDSGWTTDFASVRHKRYYKLKINLQTALANVTNPPLISQVSIEYDAGLVTEFDFEAAGCGRVSRRGFDFPGGVLILLPLFLVFLLRMYSFKVS